MQLKMLECSMHIHVDLFVLANVDFEGSHAARYNSLDLQYHLHKVSNYN